MAQNPKLSRSPDYYAARAVEERRLAMAAGNPKARAIHLEMAEKYAELAESGGAEPLHVVEEQQRSG